MKVVWLRRAVADLAAARAWIARDNPAAAEGVARAIMRTVDLLSTAPGMGRPGRKAGTRELVVTGTPYIIPYRLRDGRIELLRVLHGRRRWPA